MIRNASVIAAWLCVVYAVAQQADIPVLRPRLGNAVIRSAEGERQFNALLQRCNELGARAVDEPLGQEEHDFLVACDELGEDYWAIIGVGCSWYCGGGPDTVTATSQRADPSGEVHSGVHAHDLSYRTAWIPDGQDTVRSVTYHFKGGSPRITEVIVVNGHVLSDSAWQLSARAGRLLMSLDDVPFAILELDDTRHEQHFLFQPIGNYDLHGSKLPDWRLTFRILDTHPAEGMEYCAITEIYFDGIDDH
jgi:hypothetical protein